MVKRETTYGRIMLRTIALVFAMVFFTVTCKKFEAEPRLLISTDSVLVVGTKAFTVEGSVIFYGSQKIEQHGFCYSRNPEPVLEEDSALKLGALDAREIFQGSVDGLEGNTAYYVRAFASDPHETAYGKVLSLKTILQVPTLSTEAAQSIGQNAASAGGSILDDGGGSILQKGICWSTGTEPSLSDSCSREGEGKDSFVSQITGLKCDSRYIFRAYATNEAGTGYGDTLSFMTLECDEVKISVTTISASNVSQVSAECYGSVDHEGGSAVTERGICWNISQNPTIADDRKAAGKGLGGFSVELSGLSCHTTYYIRAYALNNTDIAYGEQLQFTTLSCATE